MNVSLLPSSSLCLNYRIGKRKKIKRKRKEKKKERKGNSVVDTKASLSNAQHLTLQISSSHIIFIYLFFLISNARSEVINLKNEQIGDEYSLSYRFCFSGIGGPARKKLSSQALYCNPRLEVWLINVMF